MRIAKKIAGFLLSAMLLLSLTPAAHAFEVLDQTKTGTISVRMAVDDEPAPGVGLTLYRVCETYHDEGDFLFRPTAEFAGSGFAFDQMDADALADPALAQGLADYVKAQGITGADVELDANGSHTFEDVQVGLYLITQYKAGERYTLAKPFLVSMPQVQLGQYLYEVNAAPKLAIDKVPPTPTPTPTATAPGIPQTGQISWPVPVLAGLGLVFVGCGWVLYRSTRQDEAEQPK